MWCGEDRNYWESMKKGNIPVGDGVCTLSSLGALWDPCQLGSRVGVINLCTMGSLCTPPFLYLGGTRRLLNDMGTICETVENS